MVNASSKASVLALAEIEDKDAIEFRSAPPYVVFSRLAFLMLLSETRGVRFRDHEYL